MKQITKANKDYSKNAKVIAAVENLLSSLNSTNEIGDFRWVTRWNGRNRNLIADQWGTLDLIDFQSEDERNNYGVTVWEHDGDLFAVPGFTYDGDWTGRSVDGQFFTVVDGKPVIDED